MSDLMDDTVKAMCKSLEIDFDRWEIERNILIDKKGGICYWINVGSERILTDVWNGHSRNTVFDDVQGIMIWGSLEVLRKNKAYVEQLKIIDSFQGEL